MTEEAAAGEQAAGAGGQHAGVMADIALAGAVIAMIQAVWSLFKSGDEAVKFVQKMRKDGQLRKWWHFKETITLRISSGPVKIFVSNVDDSADIHWNAKYLWTLSTPEQRAFEAELSPGENLFLFNLNNHGAHRFSLVADISQRGRLIRRAVFRGDEGNDAKLHTGTIRILGDPGPQRIEAKSAPGTARFKKLSGLLRELSEFDGHLSIDGRKVASGSPSAVVEIVAGDTELRRQLEEKLAEVTREAVVRRERNEDPLQATKMPIYPSVNLDTKVGWVDIDYLERPPKR